MPKRWVRAKGYGIGECIEVTPSGEPIYKFRYYTGAVRKEDIEAVSDKRSEVSISAREAERNRYAYSKK